MGITPAYIPKVALYKTAKLCKAIVEYADYLESLDTQESKDNIAIAIKQLVDSTLSSSETEKEIIRRGL